MPKHHVCIIGNSHAAALKFGLDLAPELNETLDFSFFAAQSDLMRDIELRDNLLIPTSELTLQRMSHLSGGRTEIRVDDYTVFLIVGLGFHYINAANVLRKYRLYGFNNPGNPNIPFISHACFSALIESELRKSTGFFISRLLRTASNARIIIIPQPYPSAEILNIGFWRKLVDDDLLSFTVQTYESIARKLAKTLKCEILMQPHSTLAANGVTLAKYAEDSPRLGTNASVRHPKGEASHMNAEYGVEILRNVQNIIYNKFAE